MATKWAAVCRRESLVRSAKNMIPGGNAWYLGLLLKLLQIRPSLSSSCHIKVLIALVVRIRLRAG
eukprot:COSAG02_NODE_3075_length_7421_cov_1.971592_6_plen_65_part_00